MTSKNLETQIKSLIREWAREKSIQEKSLGKIRYSGPAFGPDEYEAMMDAVFNNWWSGGKYTIIAERKLAEISGRKYAILVNSGSSANLLLMQALKHLYLKKNDKVLTLACGFPTTINPIIQSNLMPVLCDLDLDTLNIDPLTFEKSIKELDIKCAFLPHTLGYKNDIDTLLKIAHNNNVLMAFDACDAYGTIYNNKPIQHYGIAATFSFYAAHHISMGEGGAIVTDDKNLCQTIKGLRNWGKYCSSEECCIRSIDPSVFCPNDKLTKNAPIPEDYPNGYVYEWIGYNLKPLELQSAILTKQINHLPEFNEIRKQNYKILFDYFKGLKFNFKLWPIDEDVSPFVFPVLIPANAPFTRKDIVRYLKINKIESRVLFAGNITRHPAYYKNPENFIVYGSLKNSDKIMEQVLLLGISHINDNETIRKINTVLDTFFGRF